MSSRLDVKSHFQKALSTYNAAITHRAARPVFIVAIAALGLLIAIVLLGRHPDHQQMEAKSGSHSLFTENDIPPYLGIPALVARPNGHTLHPYFAQRTGLHAKYLKNIFSTNQPELAWIPYVQDGKYLLRWQTYDDQTKSGLVGIYPNEEIEFVDDSLYDFGVGTLFVKVRLPDKKIGFVLLETVAGEMEANSDLIVAHDRDRFTRNSSVEYEGIRLYEQTVTGDRNALDQEIKTLSAPSEYEKNFSASDGSIHPLLIASSARAMLFTALRSDIDPKERQSAIDSAETFFRSYVFKEKVEVKPGLISWPYKMEWTTNWGIKLNPPWYSPYCNSQIVETGALLFRLTGKPEYATIAREAMAFITTPIDKGGAEYDIGGFRLPAEYVYATPPLPNIRVLDGEFAVATAIYNGARLLGDSGMLQTSLKYFASLAMQMEAYTSSDGDLQFSQYIEKMPDGYRWPMWALVQNAGLITKDRRFSDVARRLTKFIPQTQCKSLGC